MVRRLSRPAMPSPYRESRAAPFGRTRCLAIVASIVLKSAAPFTASVAGLHIPARPVGRLVLFELLLLLLHIGDQG